MTAAEVSALPRTCYPAVWLWPGQALYAGPSLNLEPHSGSVWCLAVGVDGDLTVTSGKSRVVARSVLIPPRLVHHLDTHGGGLVSCYFDASSDRVAGCRAKCTGATGQFATEHADSAVLAQVPRDDASALRWLDLAAPASRRGLDPRIAEAIARIAADPAGAPAARELAAELGLSESRFLHLFRAAVGTSLRRYRIWMRLIGVGVALAAGTNLTDAAADAGFASPSHLADRFKSTFGLTATDLLSRGTALHLPDAGARSRTG
ncbi:helix-turn-helix domain-containing protein [Mycobacterium sp. 236(2023)]|uniref:helix-turn-helix domain-containing protein n=1 Tax=Mycobacterium sp. 236(2023) TaxID=3038163 RepID=UPI00241594C6|nr:helix-turn-helix domain-containing protein [Mycobacterium sp. 236(2023)]MDG4664444.1 helix-turn-helix domain-containing protein [Mycobacterium sp. 236(2023)]